VLLNWPPSDLSRHEARAAYPKRRSSNANSLCGQNSAGSRESERPFKRIFCHDVSEFESYHLSQAVVSYQLTFELLQSCIAGAETFRVAKYWEIGVVRGKDELVICRKFQCP
jgi:hypothetical protein